MKSFVEYMEKYYQDVTNGKKSCIPFVFGAGLIIAVVVNILLSILFNFATG